MAFTFAPTELLPTITVCVRDRPVLTLIGQGWEAVAGPDARKASDESVLRFVHAAHHRVEIRVETEPGR